jgi:hypothetical protein
MIRVRPDCSYDTSLLGCRLDRSRRVRLPFPSHLKLLHFELSSSCASGQRFDSTDVWSVQTHLRPSLVPENKSPFLLLRWLLRVLSSPKPLREDNRFLSKYI